METTALNCLNNCAGTGGFRGGVSRDAASSLDLVLVSVTVDRTYVPQSKFYSYISPANSVELQGPRKNLDTTSHRLLGVLL